MRTATWENIGNKITTETAMNGNIPEEMCFTVHKEPLYAYQNFKMTEVPGYCSVINDKTGIAYAPVSEKYQAVDNLEALGAVQYIENFKGTAWGVINAFSDYSCHADIVRKTATAAENRFISVTFDPRVMLVLTKLIQSRV